MRHHRILPALASAGLVSLLGFIPSQAGPGQQRPAFDPLFAGGASCTPARPGRPVLLASLLQARQAPLQQSYPTETRPFRPGQALPAAGDNAPPPLYKDLGKLHMPVTTSSPQAQAYFDQGLRLTFAFNHAEAQRAFRAAARIDPDCAMCHWGEALALGPNINAPMFPDAAAPAHAAAQKALQLSSRARPREQALIRAVAQRYADTAVEDRAHLDKAYADAMAEAARAYPADDTIQVLYAESLMDLAP
ncbi:hypothetical protein [Massilia aerilata]|uniref:Cytochrome c domain-containing protein n=1 Tax=Massilia aerilata TaxID=453817 RepID=A0ABW0S5N8_9BURK